MPQLTMLSVSDPRAQVLKSKAPPSVKRLENHGFQGVCVSMNEKE